MNYIFGVDGGGTGCRVGLADKDGNILSRVEGGPANIETSLTTAENNIVTTCKKALVQAGLKESILKESFAVLGLAGSNMGDFDKDLSVRLPFKKNTIINDGEITLQGAIGSSDGCIAAIGTGSVYVGRSRGIVRQIGGWGFSLGDDGSGAQLGHKLFKVAIKCHENLERHSGLTQQIMNNFNNQIVNVVKATHNFEPMDFAQYAPLIFSFYLKGDEHAHRIINEEIPVIEKSIIASGFDKEYPFCLLGGLGELYRDFINPKFCENIVLPKADAVVGAVDIACKHYQKDL